jgi:hypothetical protein
MPHERIANSERFINEFGEMLLLWRQSNGWSGQTLEDWAKACPDILPVKVLNSVITGLELKRNRRTAPNTFQGLGLANEMLAQKFRGTIRDRTLHDRIYQAEPIRHEDGRPWTAADFFAAFVGELEIPERFKMSYQQEQEQTQEKEQEQSQFVGEGFAPLTISVPKTQGKEQEQDQDDDYYEEPPAYDKSPLTPKSWDKIFLQRCQEAEIRAKAIKQAQQHFHASSPVMSPLALPSPVLK